MAPLKSWKRSNIPSGSSSVSDSPSSPRVQNISSPDYIIKRPSESLKAPSAAFLSGQEDAVQFYLPICLFWIYCPTPSVDLCSELTQVFSKNTHVDFANERAQLLGRHPFGWWFVFFFAKLANRCADRMQLCRGRLISVYRQRGMYPFTFH